MITLQQGHFLTAFCESATTVDYKFTTDGPAPAELGRGQLAASETDILSAGNVSGAAMKVRGKLHNTHSTLGKLCTIRTATAAAGGGTAVVEARFTLPPKATAYIDENGVRIVDSGGNIQQTPSSSSVASLTNAGSETDTPGASTAAAGNATGNAGALPAGTSKVYPTTGADDTKGVIISASDQVTGRMLFIGNGVSNKILKVYGPSGAVINGGSADAAFSSASGKGVIAVCLSGAGNTWLMW